MVVVVELLHGYPKAWKTSTKQTLIVWLFFSHAKKRTTLPAPQFSKLGSIEGKFEILLPIYLHDDQPTNFVIAHHR
jgi:hypothetical protein